ncbi:chemotaxis protein CheB [Methylobacter sp. S3L5C]|uniref:chemotaxis protein CheB n=1 Tax=Methylobacter sp. S3L5C TaxID=2839024 RepID=UPI001FAD561F|nr:chemotaxis protein CheB [Methylobacter sp. S3L5C]UOA06919.1 PAS domain-containing protein [Methylobacter sp. S3L5C]
MTTRKENNKNTTIASGDAKTNDGQAIKPTSHNAQETVDKPVTVFPIVGIGASAGGLGAFEAFFSGMPTDTDPDMAFVLVQHLAPDHSSILTDLIQRYTRMKVYEVENGMHVQPNCAYIIPPNRDMALLNGTLQLLMPFAPRGQRLPIDFFFRSLAQDQHERAIGIILSGTGSDGTSGARAIKAEGGIVIAQNTESTEFNGMPSSIIATGLVDYVMPPAEMPAQLITYVKHAFINRSELINTPMVPSEAVLNKIFVLLRGLTGHDFSLYKPKTIYRRIERRMAVHQIDNIDLYLKFLQQNPTEVNALFADLLIGVTNFFRDPDAFMALEKQIIPTLFIDKPIATTIRIWSTGCSTGEEAYSIAILVQEYLELIKQSYKVQVFATDIDHQAITTARAGLYPASIAFDISPNRLARFFTAESDGNGYRIHKNIRDMLVFSEHSVIKDPPFSKIDLISCRNLLIYLTSELQKKLIPLFHYALNPGGTLFLGSSESVGEFDDVFIVLDRKAKLYKRKEYTYNKPNKHTGNFMQQMTTHEVPLLRAPGKTNHTAKLSLRELTEQALLQHVAPASALVNNQGDILYLHGRTGRYLEPTPGESGINNILKMAREGLKLDLTTSLHKAVRLSESIYSPGLRVKTNGHFTLVNLTIHPVTLSPTTTTTTSLYLVTLEEAQGILSTQTTETNTEPSTPSTELETDERIKALKLQLRQKDEYMQAFHEELETSNEELKCSNEEMQSVNEELQSTNEELETSKEELQSVNEELATVNAELQTKLADLSRANNDMNNLLAGTGIATIFLDLQLRILRFTPTACKIMNLLINDVGRPVSHLALNLVGYDRLMEDTNGVLNTLIPKAVDVQTADYKWFAMRIQPYRTLDNIIEGVVITFVDITEIVQARDALRRLAIVVRDATDAITVQDLNGHILAWNPGAVKLYGWSEAEALKMNVRDLILKDQQEQALTKDNQISATKTLEPYYTQRVTKAGATVNVWIIATALVNEVEEVYAIATTARLIESKNAQLIETPNGH